ncbi:hypothetical protein SAMN05428967_1447 [Phyllobacterium sp. YR620]|nr:hypothetical protein SAMN05428967_1447 [Phyllobacterium sp. YR620]
MSSERFVRQLRAHSFSGFSRGVCVPSGAKDGGSSAAGGFEPQQLGLSLNVNSRRAPDDSLSKSIHGLSWDAPFTVSFWILFERGLVGRDRDDLTVAELDPRLGEDRAVQGEAGYSRYFRIKPECAPDVDAGHGAFIVISRQPRR